MKSTKIVDNNVAVSLALPVDWDKKHNLDLYADLTILALKWKSLGVKTSISIPAKAVSSSLPAKRKG